LPIMSSSRGPPTHNYLVLARLLRITEYF